MRRPFGAILPILLVAWALPPASELLQEPMARLRAMPHEERIALQANLRRFRELGPDARSRIQRLDAELAAMPDAERARYVSLMDRYSHWLATIPPETRAEIEAATPERRVEIITQHQADREPARNRGERPTWVRSEIFNPVPIFEVYYLLQIWVRLDEGQKREVDREVSLRDRRARLEQFGRQLGVERNPEFLDEFRRAFEEIRQRFGARLNPPRLSPEDLLRPWPTEKRSLGAPAAKAQAQLERTRGVVLRNIEAKWAAGTIDSAKPVPPAELTAFEARLPGWYRETVDPLPPDSARERLTLLYRLLETDESLVRAFGAPATPPTAPRTPGATQPPPTPRPPNRGGGQTKPF